MTTQEKTALWPYAVGSAAVCAVALVAALVSRNSACIYGVSAAALGALCALSALGASARKGLNGVLAGFSLGFLARAIFVAVGLIASGARGQDALSYVFSFFGVYAATQLVEVLFVRATSRVQGTGAATP